MISYNLVSKFVEMSILYVVLLFVAGCMACDEDLHYRISNGNYLIVNPDPNAYNGIQAIDANGTACTTTVIEGYAFTVSGCGPVDVQLDLLIDDTVTTSCTISSDGAERTQNGISVPIDFVMKSNSLLRSGSAHYHCKVRAIGSSILVKNPRKELYKHSYAQASTGAECTTSHILDNQVIEISDCDIENVILIVGSRPIVSARITRQTGIFPIDCSGVDLVPQLTSTGNAGGLPYNCYDDGSITAVNPRSELFCFSYAEQNGQQCASTYVKDFSQIIISGCNPDEGPIFVLLSKFEIDFNALVLGPSNVFLVDCSA